MKFTRRKASAKKRTTTAMPYRVTVYNADTREAVEIKRFTSYESAQQYASIYNGDGGHLGAFIDYLGY